MLKLIENIRTLDLKTKILSFVLIGCWILLFFTIFSFPKVLHELYRSYISLCWFISMAVSTIFNSLMPLSIVIPIFISASPFLIKNDGFTNFKKDINIKRRVALMPLFWVFIGFGGGIFQKQKHGYDWPNFIEHFVLVFFVLFVIYGIYCCFKNQGYRIITIILFVINLYFAFVISLFAFMSITGNWL